ALAVDGGGPYFHVGPGIATLARTLKAYVVPLAVGSTRSLPWIHRSQISFPWPSSRITAAVGSPIDGLAGDRHAVAAAVQAALESLAKIVQGSEVEPEPSRH